MRTTHFTKDSPGRLVPTVYDAMAFLPDPLPPRIDFSLIAGEFGEAMSALGELKGTCRKLPNPYLLIRPLQRLEAQTTSAMEGTYTTADDLAKTEAGVEKSPTSDTIEAANYIRALGWSQDQLKQIPISGRLLKGAHKVLLESVAAQRGRDKQPGEYARDQNMIGGTSIENARFIPPPPAETLDAMSALEAYINTEEKAGRLAVVDLALVHYQFETIHPFADGNGRLGRMLITLMAMTEGLLDLPVLYLSPELETRKDEYIDRMYRVSTENDWEGWLKFFLNMTTVSCRRTTATIDRILDLQKEYAARIQDVSRSSNVLRVVEMLFDRPYVDAKIVVSHINVTDAAARNILRQLEDLEVLVEVPNVYPKLWLASEILNISDPSMY